MINVQDPEHPIQRSDEEIRVELSQLSEEEILQLLAHTKERKTKAGVMEPRFHILLKELNQRITPKTQEWFEQELCSIVDNRDNNHRCVNWGGLYDVQNCQSREFSDSGKKQSSTTGTLGSGVVYPNAHHPGTGSARQEPP